MKRNFTFSIFLLFFLSAFLQITAQKVRVIDNKGTLRYLNRVTVGNTAHSEPVEGDIWFDTSATSFGSGLSRQHELRIYDNGSWIKLRDNIYTSDGKLEYHRTIVGGGNNIRFKDINTYLIEAKKVDIKSWITPITLNPRQYNYTGPGSDPVNYGIIAEGPFWGKKAYRDSDGDVGTNGQILSSVSLGSEQGTNWVNASSLITGLPGSVFFANTDGTVTEDNDHFFWDKTNERLYIGAKLAGTNKLNVAGTTRTQGVSNSDGSVNRPSYRFTGDSNTGMFRGTSADHLRFTTGGQEAVTIDNSQNVGIGINNPDKKLDVNGEVKIRNLPTGAKTDNFIVHNADGELKSINADKIHSVVTSSVTSGHEIATHQANDIATSIKETVTNITDSNTATDIKVIATYTNENGGTPQDIEETVTKIEQINGTSNPPANPNFGQDKTGDSPGDIKYYNENNPTTNPTRVRVVSTDSGNSLKIGSDGGAYYVGPRIAAAGKVNGQAAGVSMFNSTVSKTDTSWYTWDYRITFSNSLTQPYIVNATPYLDNPSSIVRVLKVFNQGPNGFTIRITNGLGGRQNDTGFMFSVISW